MDEAFEILIEEFGEHFPKEKISPEAAKTLKDSLPRNLINFLSEHGAGGFGEGLFWLTNPLDYELVCSEWLSNTSLTDVSRFHVIARSAFGNMLLWNNQTGSNVTIDPLAGTVYISAPDDVSTDKKKDRALSILLASQMNEDVDIEDIKDKPLFKRAIKKLGKISSDEMYAFEPALSIGGLPTIENMVKVKMEEHLILLSQLSEIREIHIDVSKHVG
jgi:hypothetical protein